MKNLIDNTQHGIARINISMPNNVVKLWQQVGKDVRGEKSELIKFSILYASTFSDMREAISQLRLLTESVPTVANDMSQLIESEKVGSYTTTFSMPKSLLPVWEQIDKGARSEFVQTALLYLSKYQRSGAAIIQLRHEYDKRMSAQ